MKPQALEVFKIFEKTHGEQQAKTIIEYLENGNAMAIEKAINSKIEHLATKNDLFLLKKDLMATREELVREIGDVKIDLASVKADVANFKTDMFSFKADMISFKTDITKAVYIVGLVQFLAIIGAVLAIVSFMSK